MKIITSRLEFSYDPLLLASLTFMLFHFCGFLTDAQLLYSNCSKTGNYTAKSSYESNRNIFLDSFPSNVQLIDFYNATVGMPPDRVYGLVFCRGDLNADDCRNCVNVAREEIRELCPYQKVASVWYDYCVLRYSDANIFSNVTESFNWIYMYSSENVPEPLPLKQALGNLLDRLVLQAVNGTNGRMLAAAETDFRSSSSQKLYGLVQCRRTVSRKGCQECLDIAVSRLQACCSGKVGGRILGADCLLMHDDYPFFTSSPPPLLQPHPPASPSPPLPPPLLQQPRADEFIRPVPAGESNKGDSGKRKWLVPVVILIILMAFLMLGTFIYLCKKRGNKHETLLDEDGNNNNSADLPFYDFASIMVATDRFSDSNKLGQGGFGAVYRGKLPQGQEVAVKRLSKSSGQGAEEFKNEVILIAKLQHRNLVRLLGYCILRDEKMLLYEYMPNRSLDFFLFDKTRSEFLDWTRRFVIILGIARGLLYLHQDSRLRIIHRDLKTSNILLDEEMNPKISDFGLARIFEGNQTEESTNRVVGTYGYMSPEYASHGLFSVKSDVFSFGVILIEIITGRKNTSFFHSEDYLTLLGHAWQLWKEGKGLDLMDPSITETTDKEEVLKCLQVGLLCVEEDAADRPTMATVITLLTSETAMLPTPRKPALFVRSHSKNVSSQNSAKNCSNCEVTMSCLEGR